MKLKEVYKEWLPIKKKAGQRVNIMLLSAYISQYTETQIRQY